MSPRPLDGAEAMGEAELARARAIEAAIADPAAAPPAGDAAADEIAFGRRLNASLQAAFGPVADAPVPPALVGLAVRRPSTWPQRVAAGIVLLAVGLGGGWLLRGSAGSDPADPTARFTADAHRAHVIYVAEQRHPVEVAASEDHLFRWLSNRLGGDIVAPPLAQFGFSLLGGRLLPQDDRVAAQFMYQDDEGHRLTLYVAAFADSQATEVQVRAFDDSSALYWTDGDFGFAMVGDLPRERLIAIAHAAYEALEPRGPS
ncbi:MAG: anti-sigma factor [Alphaproteobacteria bacterium]